MKSLIFHLTLILLLNSVFGDYQQSLTTLCGNEEAALGMESGAIPDSALSASSSFSANLSGPHNARLNRELNAGAWCPSPQIDSNSSGSEWIQVNLNTRYVITKVATQGRHNGGLGQEFTEKFQLKYSRDGENWIQWHDPKQPNIFHLEGNTNPYSNVTTQLPVPLVGVTVIRLYPISDDLRSVCLRFELFGCAYPSAASLSYSLNDGNFLRDDTYDGTQDRNGLLMGGLGQLVDGIKGKTNYSDNNDFEWVGWQSNETDTEDDEHHQNGHTSITFEFAEVRNFTEVLFHCNHQFSLDIGPFHSAHIWFSTNGSAPWAHTPDITFGNHIDSKVEDARDVPILLHNRVGQFVRFDLYYSAKFLLISEVTFRSKPISKNSPATNMNKEMSSIEAIDNDSVSESPTSQSSNQSKLLYRLGNIAGFIFVVLVVLLLLKLSFKRSLVRGGSNLYIPVRH